MKEDATAKELESLLREALNSGLESPRGGTPILQLKTVPLQVQSVPMKPAASASATPAPVVDVAPPSGLAERLAPDSVRPPATKAPEKSTRSRSSFLALLALGAFAVAAAGGAAWLARDKHAVPVASAATTTAPHANEQSSEGAVGISIAARPGDAPASTETSNVDAPAAAVPAPPPTFVAPVPEPASAKAEGAEAKEAKAEAKVAKAEVKPRPSPAPAAPKAEVKSEKTATSEKTDKTEKKEAAPSAPAPASPPAGSVDALLQQQLKGAIP